MSELAIKRMTVAEFLRWEDGTDTRYELLGGSPVAMAPPAIAHGILALRLGARIDAALRSRPPCFGQSEAGIVRPDRDDTCYVADLAVSCSPPERGQQLLQDPLLIVEILSPGTAEGMLPYCKMGTEKPQTGSGDECWRICAMHCGS